MPAHRRPRPPFRRTLLRQLGISGGLAATAVAGVAVTTAAAAPASAQPSAMPRVAHTAVSVPSLPYLPRLLMIGSRGSYVTLAQGQLGVATDGVFGPVTRSAVRRFQSAHGLAVDGVIGPVTWGALGRSAPAPAHHASRSSSTHPLLREGSRGAAVESVQRDLGVSADGVFGPVTRSAVVRFQSSRGLSVDGVVGPQTWRALDSGARPVSHPSSSLGARAVRIASEQGGIPYAYGGASPSAGFDCSGLVKYTFGQLGHNLPHSADMQYHAVRHVSKSNMRPGDIVFIPNSNGYITHDGIYAGGGYWWVASHAGTVIHKQRIYTSHYYVGRVG
jgi:peptidoglycan hydrolase-like protein with peptidoglycan-binding domain